jgi:hypothetical protein
MRAMIMARMKPDMMVPAMVLSGFIDDLPVVVTRGA